MAIKFDQRCPAFIVGYYTQDVAIRKLLPVISTLEKWSCSGKFGTWHELEMDLKNARTQFLVEICLDLKFRIQSLAYTLLDSYYEFMMTLIIHMDAEITII